MYALRMRNPVFMFTRTTPMSQMNHPIENVHQRFCAEGDCLGWAKIRKVYTVFTSG